MDIDFRWRVHLHALERIAEGHDPNPRCDGCLAAVALGEWPGIDVPPVTPAPPRDA